MKYSLFAAAVALLGVSEGAMTLQFASTTAVLTNLQNSLGQTNQTLVWGIVVDTAGNGFSSGTYAAAGFNITDNAAAGTAPNGQFLSKFEGGVTTLTDDLLVISTNLMSLSGTGDGSTGFARPTNLVGLNYVNGVTQGDAFGLIWFDYTTKTGQAPAIGDNYGFLSIPAFVLPADAGSSLSFASNFSGVDVARPANLELLGVPEPSVMLLGALGMFGLVRRRR